MKKIALTTALLVAFTTMVNAQGTINFANRDTTIGLDAPIREDDGTTLLAGAAYLAQLYAGPNAGSLTPQGSAVVFRTGAAIGYIAISTTAVSTVLPGASASLQFRVWRASDGASYDAAALIPGSHIGSSGTLTATLGGVPDPITGIPGFAANMPLFSGFNLSVVPVPEPSTFALLGLGAVGLLFRRRK